MSMIHIGIIILVVFVGRFKNHIIKKILIMKKKLCVIIGVGPGNGTVFASRFSKEGYHLALLARSTDLTNQLAKELVNASAYECDVSKSDSIQNPFFWTLNSF